MNKQICFVMDASPKFLGGTSIYVLNFIKYLQSKKLKFKITCIFPGELDREYIEGEIKFIEVKNKYFFPINMHLYTKKVAKILSTKRFDYINSQAMAGNYLRYYVPKNSFITNTYHGVAYYFYKIHFEEKSLLKKIGALYYMFFGRYFEKAAINRANKIISVSNHVERELKKIYGSPHASEVIRSSVDLLKFKLRDRKAILTELSLAENKIYGLYVGRGGPWRKGLDRAINLSRELYKLNNKYFFIIIGPTENMENKKIISKLSGKYRYIPIADRDLLSKYYSLSDIFFCFSRYEGGAPILTLGEAMASGCIPICSKDSNQEIIEKNKNGILINDFKENSAKKVINLIKNKKQISKIKRENKIKIKDFSIALWGEKYFEAITNEK